MATRDELLRDLTFKDQCDGLGRRVYYTLTDDRALESHRCAKAIALLIEVLHEKLAISEAEIDDLLLDAIK